MRNSNFEYRAEARRVLQGYWGEGAILSLVVILAVFLCTGGEVYSSYSSASSALGGIGTLLEILVLIPLSYGFNQTFLSFYRGEGSLDFSNLFRPFREDFARTVVASLTITILVSLVSVFTFGIGGIYLGLCWAMVPFLLKDYPELTWREALRISREMMMGHKWDFFCLQLSFIGWILLSILTAGFGIIFLMPYMTVAEAAFYDDLKNETIEEVEEKDNIEEAEVIE